MKWNKLFAVVTLSAVFATAEEAAKPPVPPDLKQLQQIITVLQEHYADQKSLTNESISAAAVEGVLHKLGPTAQVLPAAEAAKPADAGALMIAKQRTFLPAIGYVRIGVFQSGLAKAMADSLNQLVEKKVNGLIVDLRFANGRDFEEAAAVAGLFVAKDKPLLELRSPEGAVLKKLNNANDPLFSTLPIVLVVNGGTAGAPEAFAGILQQYKRALIMGAATSGEAFVRTDLPLDKDNVLRLATTKVAVAQGSDLWRKPIDPEIRVKIDPAEERAFVSETAPKKPAKPLHSEGGIHSEAELLSIYQTNVDPTTAKQPIEQAEQTDDPALQRALDVLSAWRTFQPAGNPAPSSP